MNGEEREEFMKLLIEENNREKEAIEGANSSK